MSFSERQSLLSSFGFSLMAMVWTSVVTLLTIPMTLHGLGLEAYGIYSVAYAIAALGSHLDLGMSWTTARFVAEADTDHDVGMVGTVLAASLVYQLIVGVVFVLLLCFASEWVATAVLQVAPEQAQLAGSVLRIAAASFLCGSLSGVFLSALRGMRQFRAATIITMTATTISVTGVAATASLNLGVNAAAAAQLAGVLIGLIALAFTCRRLLQAASGGVVLWQRMRTMFTFSVWTYLTRLVYMLVTQGDKIMVARAVGAAGLPFYSVPFNFAQRINFLAGPAVTAIYPIAAFGQANRESFVRQFLGASRLVHVCTAAVALTIIILGDRFLQVWIGPEMADHGTVYLQILAASFWIISGCSIDSGCIEAWNRPRANFLAAAWGVAGGIVTVACLWPVLGHAVAVAVGVLAYSAVLGGSVVVIWYRMARYSLSFMLRRVVLTIVEMSVIAILIAGVVRQLEGIFAVLMAMVGSTALLAGFGLTQAFSRTELVAVMGRLIPWRTKNEHLA